MYIFMNNFNISVGLKFLMRYCIVLIILGFPKLGNTFWPASYRVDLSDHKTFVITAGEDDDDEDEERENEMIRPEDLAEIVDLVEDEERYKPLHSHVEHYNRRAAEAAKQYSLSNPYLQASMEETNLSNEEKPFIAGFKDELDKYHFDREVKSDKDILPRKNDSGVLSSGVKKNREIVKTSLIKNSRSKDRKKWVRSKRQEELGDILGLNDNSDDDLVQSMRPRNNSLEQDGHATPNPSNLENLSSTTERLEEYEDDKTSISGDRVTSRDDEISEKKETSEKKSVNIFAESELTTPPSEFGESEEETYDYESLRAEYEQQIVDARLSNKSYNYTEKDEPEDTPVDAIKKIVNFDKPKNCTEEELTKFGARSLECLAFDYHNAKNKTDVRRIIARTWNVVKVWICIYVCIAVPAWCQKGWCCCCFRCSMCFPRRRIVNAKEYYANNEPGILVDQPSKDDAKPETLKYQPTLFEIDAYERFESAIRNL